MIIDSFLYFNEIELLELRIKLLHNFVDKFLIFDGNRTHTGLPKEFTCKDTLNKLNILSNKIQVIELDLSIYDNDSDCWGRANGQLDALSKYVNDNDNCIVSCCDEIINPQLIKRHSEFLDYNTDTLLLVPLYYLQHRADLQVSDGENNLREWQGAYMCRGKIFKSYKPTDLRTKIQNGGDVRNWPFPVTWLFNDNNRNGWHFAWMGDNERKNLKSNSYAHAFDEIHKEEKSKNYNPIEGGIDYLGREDHILTNFDTSLLPQLIYDLPKVKEFLLP